MITHTMYSYLIPLISSQNYIVRRCKYKAMNLIKPKIYVKGYTNYHIRMKYESSSIKNRPRNAKKVQNTS